MPIVCSDNLIKMLNVKLYIVKSPEISLTSQDDSDDNRISESRLNESSKGDSDQSEEDHSKHVRS